jgi:hypothetical protein
LARPELPVSLSERKLTISRRKRVTSYKISHEILGDDEFFDSVSATERSVGFEVLIAVVNEVFYHLG